MIFFKEDWNYYPQAIYDDSTSNHTFLYYADLLSSMGIDNYLFPLSLLNPDLKGIDPFAKETIEDPLLCDLITKECKMNYWYYLREICRLKGQGTDEPMQFGAHRANMAFSWVTMLNIDVNCTLARQKGKSVAADAVNSYHINIAGEGLDVQLYTKDNKLRVENVAKLKSMRDLLPPYLNYFQKNIDADNNAEVTCKALRNKYMTAVAQKTEDGAENTGRGLSSPRQQMDELPYCSNCHISVPASLGGTSATRKLAIKQGSPYGLMVTTTAGKKDTDEGQFAYNLIHGGIDWTEELLQCKDRAELMDAINTNRRGKRDIVNITMNHRQLGITDAEFVKEIENAGTDKEQTERDYLCKWTSGGVYSPLSATLNDTIADAVRDPVYTELNKYNFMVDWFKDKHETDDFLNDNYTVASLDSSNVSGGDGNGLTISCLKTMDMIGASNVNITSLTTYSQWVASLLIKYPKMTFVFENKSSGQAIMDTVAMLLVEAGIDPFTRCFNRIFQEGNVNDPKLVEIQNYLTKGIPDYNMYLKYKKFFGFMTTGATREHLYNHIFYMAAQSCGHLVKDKNTSMQIRSLEKKNNRIDHPKGGNDDMVIAWMLGHYFSLDGKNLAMYGIPYNYVRTGVSKNGASLTPEQVKELREQSIYKAKVNDYKEELKKTKDVFGRSIIKSKLEKILKLIKEDSTEWTLEHIIKSSEQSKTKLHQRVRGFV